MEVLTRLLVKCICWHPFERGYREGDWFDPAFRKMINAECEWNHLPIPFDQRKDLS